MASGAAVERAEGDAQPLVARQPSVEECEPQAGGAGRLRLGLSAGLLCAMGGACAYAAVHVRRAPPRAGVQEGARAPPRTLAEGVDAALVRGEEVSWRNATWVRGDEGENCEDACVRFGLACYESEDSFPRQLADVSRIAEGLGLECKDQVSAENTYDPFVVGPFCSVGPWKPPNVWADWRPRNIRSCKAAPPRATTRLCPCVKEVPDKGCEECNEDCWQTDSCCTPEEDGCSEDPMLDKENPDYDWWGAGVNWEWAGVDPESPYMANVKSFEELPRLWNATTDHSEPLRIKVLTYNLFWWNLFDEKGGDDGAAGKLVAESGDETPYDLMAFQECENIEWVLGDANLSNSTEFSEIHHSVCVAWRNQTWRKLDAGTDVVATDGGWVRNNKWGDRIVSWVRLEHTTTGDKVLFANHHGPLPLNSGGEAGGLATAHNLLSAIKAHGEEGDIIVLAGDFNSDYRSATVKMLSTRLSLGYHGESFGGIDNIFANTGSASFSDTINLGGAGSDHDALTATITVPLNAWKKTLGAVGPAAPAPAAAAAAPAPAPAAPAAAAQAAAAAAAAAAQRAADAAAAAAAPNGALETDPGSEEAPLVLGSDSRSDSIIYSSDKERSGTPWRLAERGGALGARLCGAAALGALAGSLWCSAA